MANALFSKPIRNPSSWEEVVKHFFKTEANKIRTIIPARVIEVDYEKSLVLVQPLIRTWWEKWRAEVTMWPLEGIPIVFSSAGRGSARITLPVKKGDVGLVLFADRHTDRYLGSTGEEVVDSGSMITLGIDGYMNVIGFLPEIFTESKNKGFRQDALVVEYGSGKITIEENGKVTYGNGAVYTVMSDEGDSVTTNGNITSEIGFDGSASIDNGNGKIELKPDGSINLNGLIINPDGTIADLEVVGSLKKGGVEVNAP